MTKACSAGTQTQETKVIRLPSIIGNLILTQILKELIYYKQKKRQLLHKITLFVNKTKFAQQHLGYPTHEVNKNFKRVNQ